MRQRYKKLLYVTTFLFVYLNFFVVCGIALDFKSRTREGCDLQCDTITRVVEVEFQSTHPRGVRPTPPYFATASSRFNPRTREGCDSRSGNSSQCESGFNPRTREGCDIINSLIVLLWWGFNPRTREGCDILPTFPAINCPMFQSTHPRGVRRKELVKYLSVKVSIHAPARGVTLLMSSLISFKGVSIHAPTKGATVNAIRRADLLTKFQSTHPRGVRLPLLSSSITALEFQSTHPRGVRLTKIFLEIRYT